MSDGVLETHADSVKTWLRAWNTPDLDRGCTVEFSPRLTRSLGRAYLERSLIRITEKLKTERPELLKEVLCHELAHLAARKLHGNAIRPHGDEWKTLMSAAGYEPRVRLPAPDGFKAKRRRRRYWYLHFCPNCQHGRVARRSMRRWRCARCVSAGLHGTITITRAASARGHKLARSGTVASRLMSWLVNG